MSRTLQFRRYSSAQLANTTGANGEIIINTTTHGITVHDGSTPGGFAPESSGADQYARTTANGATNLAQSAYNFANTIVSDTQIDPYARTTANNASSNVSIIQGVDVTQNTRLSSIETININQNTSISIIQGVDVTQNTRLNSIETINTSQNTSISILQGVNNTQNTRLNAVETINANQDTSISVLEGVNTSQNNTIVAVNNFAQGAYNKANTGSSTGNYTFSGNNVTLGANATANLTVSSYEASIVPLTYTRNPDANATIFHFDYGSIDPSAKTITFYTYGGAGLITNLVSAYNNGATINVAYDGTDTYNITPGITKYGDIVLTSFINTSGSTWVGTYNETLATPTNSVRVFIVSWDALVNSLVPKSWLFNNTGTLTFPDNTTQTGGSISITELKALVANAATYTDFQTAISNL